MNKESINNRMLFKLRDGRLCVLIPKGNDRSFYSKNCIFIANNTGGLSDLYSYNDDLTSTSSFIKYDIIAIKQYSTVSEAFYYLLNNIEPKEWDWVREEKKEEIIPFTFILKEKKKVKSVKLPACIRSRK